MSRRFRATIVVLGMLALAFGQHRTRDAQAAKAPLAEHVDLGTLTPGLQAAVPLGGLELEVSVPADEGHTGGSLRVQVPAVGFDSGALPRNGSMEAAYVADVNGDEAPDAVLVVRGGGSGSYASILVVESSGTGFVARELPDAPSSAGYMGHDVVTVRGGRIVRSFATYVNRSELRIDRQWSAERGARGEVPIRSKPDTNTSPSGRTLELVFDRMAGRWTELR